MSQKKMNSQERTLDQNIHVLEELYKGGQFDEIHSTMSQNPQTPTAITSEMHIWYGKFLEMIGEDTQADQQYILAGRDGEKERIRNLLRSGCTVTEAIHQVNRGTNPQASAFLARFLEFSYPDEPALNETIVRLYCTGNCIDYAAWFAVQHENALTDVFISAIEEESLTPPIRKVNIILSRMEDACDYEGKVRLLAMTCDGAHLAVQECIIHNQPATLRYLITQHRLKNVISSLMRNDRLREDTIKMILSLRDTQLLFDFYTCLRPLHEERIFQLYVRFHTTLLTLIDLTRSPITSAWIKACSMTSLIWLQQRVWTPD